MGLSSFPNSVSEGVLPILIVNTALSFAILKNILRSILEIVGIAHYSEPELIEAAWPVENPNSPVEMMASAHTPEFHLIAEEIRNSLPVRRFQYEEFVSHDEKNQNDFGHVECSVCLSSFEEGEEIRQLPCRHFFHRPCLDKWLDHHHTTCPLCRSYLITQDISMRLMEQELTDDHIFWYSSLQEAGYHGMWIES